VSDWAKISVTIRVGDVELTAPLPSVYDASQPREAVAAVLLDALRRCYVQAIEQKTIRVTSIHDGKEGT